MIDTNYISELKELGGKEAKEALAEYAKGFGITIKKTRSFDNIVLDIETKLAELANEPMPEQNEGITIADLIQAVDEADGKAIFTDDASEAAKNLVAGKIEEVKAAAAETMTHLIVDPPKEHIAPFESMAEIVVKLPPAVEHVTISAVPEPELYELPKSFSPTLTLMGQNPGYCTLPWWIYEWITQNEDWKQNPNKIPHAYALSTLQSLIYYIKRDGSVKIRETRNSRFVILK